jgi:hypothetical protein
MVGGLHLETLPDGQHPTPIFIMLRPPVPADAAGLQVPLLSPLTPRQLLAVVPSLAEDDQEQGAFELSKVDHRRADQESPRLAKRAQ